MISLFLKNQIEAVLTCEPETRNSDILLLIRVWQKYYGVYDVIMVNDIFKLPQENSISRLRRQIQNDEKRLLPTDEKIALERGWKADEWKRILGYGVPDPRQLAMF